MYEKIISFMCYYKPIADDQIERRHKIIYDNFKDFTYPFNFEIPEEAPKFGRDDLSTSLILNHKEIKTLKFISRYRYRHNGNIEDNIRLGLYDNLEIKFGTNKKEIDYKDCLYNLFPKVVELYGGCRAKLFVRRSFLDYPRQFELIESKLRENKKIDFDGRNHIFMLHSAQHWGEDLCRAALGYSAKEAMKRLEKAGALMVESASDGVYFVLNDNKEIELEEFTEMNSKFKQVLGIKDGTWTAPSTLSKLKFWKD